MSTDFGAAATARAIDANQLRLGQRSCGAVYKAGYSVECRLKALLMRMGRSFPTSGQQGHNLRALWAAAGFGIHDLSGARRAFIEFWSTDLRYEAQLPPGTDYDMLFDGVIGLSGYIQLKLRSARRR